MHHPTRRIHARFAGLTLLLVLVLGLLTPTPAFAQGDADEPDPEPTPNEVDPRFESPRATMNTFVDAATRLSAGRGSGADRETMIRALGLGPTQRDKASDYGAALLGVINRVGYVDSQLPDANRAAERTAFSFLPADSAMYRSSQGEAISRHDGALIAMTRTEAGAWVFSDKTIAGIEAFYDDVAAMPRLIDGADETNLSDALWIESFLPDVLKSHFLGVKAWKWVGLFLIILVGLIIDLIVRSILKTSWRRLERQREVKACIADKTLAKAVRPFGLLVAAGVALVGLPLLGLPEVALLALLFAARLILTIAGVMTAYRVADLIAVFFEGRATRTDTKIDDLLVPLVRKAAKIFITAVGVVYLADALTIPILPLLSGLGIGGLAIAFAAKDTIENFFGSLAVIIDSPFDVGDWVVVGDVEGVVEELGFRSTRVRTFYNSLVTVPNATLVRANVDNYGRRKYRRLSTHVSIAYDTPPDTIEAFCEGIREIIRSHPYTRKDYYQVWLHKMASASLDILLYVFHEAPNWETELRERQRLFLDIMRLARSMNIEFAFPTQTLYLRNEEGWAPPETGDARTESESIRSGRAVADQVMRDAEWRKRTPPPYRFDVAGKRPEDETQVETRIGGDG